MKIAAVLATVVLLAGCGSAAKAPATTVTSTATTTTTATEPATPKSCQDALDDADRIIDLASTAFDSAGTAIEAYGNEDVAGIEAQTEKIKQLTPKMQAARAAYDEDSLVCRATPQ